MVAITLYLNSFSHYSSAFVTTFSFVRRQKTLSGWGLCFLTEIISNRWLDGTFIKDIREEFRCADSSTAQASLSNTIPLPLRQLDETGGLNVEGRAATRDALHPPVLSPIALGSSAPQWLG